jgi:hypothetical protein
LRLRLRAPDVIYMPKTYAPTGVCQESGIKSHGNDF